MNERRTSGARKGARRCSESGQSLLEFALMLPVLVLLLLGVIEIGRYAYLAILVGNAARAGAAYGARNPTTANDTNGIIQAADNDFQNNGPSVGTLNVTSEWNNNCGCDNGGTVTPISCTTACSAGEHLVVTLSVTASGTFNSIFNYPGIPSSINVARTATLRIGN